MRAHSNRLGFARLAGVGARDDIHAGWSRKRLQRIPGNRSETTARILIPRRCSHRGPKAIRLNRNKLSRHPSLLQLCTFISSKRQ